MGVGKTSLGDALTWCLYGNTTPRKPGSAAASLRGDEVVHDEAKEVYVTLQLEVDGKPISITRSKRKGSGAKVKIEGIEESEGVRDQQMLVNNIIGLDFDLWRMCVYLGQGAVSNFVTDADKRRKDVLSRTLNLGACSLAQKIAREKKKALETEMQTLKIELAKATSAYDTWSKIDYEKQSRTWFEENKKAMADAEDKVKDLQQQLDKMKLVGADEEKALLEKKQKATMLMQRANEFIKTAAVNHQAKISGHSKRLGQLQAEQSASEKEKSMMEAEIHRQHAHTPTSTVKEGMLGKCITCGQPISHDIKEQIVSDLIQKVRYKSAEILRLGEDRQVLEREVEAENKAYSEKRNEKEKELGQLQKDHLEYTEKLAILASTRNNRQNLEKALEEATKNALKLKQTKNPFEEQTAGKATLIQKLQEEMKQIKAKLEVTEKHVLIAEFWETGFGPKGIPVTALSAVLHELEDYANHFLALLLQGRINCTLSMEGEDLQINFHEFDPVTGKLRPRSFTQLSGGQRRCAELAFSPFALSEMVFNRSGVRIPFLIVDEMTTHLDPTTKPLVCEVLRRLGKDTVLVIDHDQSVQGEFDSIIELSRKSNTGQLVLTRIIGDPGGEEAVGSSPA